MCFLATCPDSAALDPSLLQRGRLEAVLRIGALDSAARASILGIHARGMVLELAPPLRPSSEPPIAAPSAAAVAGIASADTHPAALAAAGTTSSSSSSPSSSPRTREEFLGLVAARCHGYLGSDLERLCREAAMSHMSATTTAVMATDALSSTAATAAAIVSGEITVAVARGPEYARRREEGAEGIGCVKGVDGRAEGRGSGGDCGGGSGGGEAVVRLRDFWAALNVVRPASLVGHSVGMWGGEAGQQVWLGGRLVVESGTVLSVFSLL